MKIIHMNPFFAFTVLLSLLSLCSPVRFTSFALPMDTTNWINWEDSITINLLNNLLSITDNPCNKETLNSIIDKITDDTGSLYIPIGFEQPLLLSEFNITGVTISGLDTLTEATLFEAVNEYYLLNHLKFDDLEVVVHGHASKKELLYGTVTETFTFTAALKDASADATVLLGVDSSVLGGLYVDQLSLGCLGSSIADINVTSKAIGVSSWSCACAETVTSKKGSGFVCSNPLSKGLCPVATAPTSAVVNMHERSSIVPSLSHLMGEFIDMDSVLQQVMDNAFTSVQQLIVTEATKLLQENEFGSSATIALPDIPEIPSLNSLLGALNCSAHVPHSHGSPPNSYVNFMAEDGLWSKVAAGLALLDVSGIDASIACATEQQSGTPGTIAIPGDLFDINLRGTTIAISDLVVSGLNSISQLLLLQPVDDYELKSKIGIDHLVLQMGIDISSTSSLLHKNGFSLEGSYEMVFNMSEFHLVMSSIAELDLSKLDDLTLSQINSRGCVMSSFDMLQLNEFVLHMQQALLVLEPTSTMTGLAVASEGVSSRDMNDFVQSMLSIYVNILSSSYNDNYDAPILSFITHPDKIALPSLPSGNGIHMDLAPELNKLLNNSGKLIDKFLLDNLVNNANATCHNESSATTNSFDDDGTPLPVFDDDQEGVDVNLWETSMGFISFAVMALVILASGAFSWMARMKRRKVAQKRGYGHLGNEFVVVRADELFRDSSNNHDSENSTSSGSGEEYDNTATSQVNKFEGSTQGESSGEIPKATVGKPINELFQNKKPLVDGDHITPGKHLDENGDEIDENEIVDSLFHSERISKGYRYGLPGCCALVALLFVSANCFDGAAVYAMIEAGPLEPISTFNFFTFTLKSSVHDFWQAKVYFLSVLIAMFSGAWPYGKLILISGCFIMPMQRKRREVVFTWLDALGKWSLLDSYVLVAMMVAFNFKIFLGPTETADGEPLKITIFTKPGYGFYSFLLATMCSMALGHAATFFHRYDASPVNRIPGGGPSESLACHFYQPSQALKAQAELKKKQKKIREEKKQKREKNRGSMVKSTSSSNFNPIYEDLISDDKDDIDEIVLNNNDSLVKKGNSKKKNDTNDDVMPYYEREQPSFTVKYGIALVIVATFGVLMMGGFVHSFKFTFGGLTGLILDTVAGPGSTPRSKSYSLISTYETLPTAYPNNNDLGIWFIQQTYLLYGFWVPALHLCLLLIIWLVPLTLRTQATALALGEIANAWSAVDVFIFSIFAALLQISKFAAFIVEEPCGSPIAALGGKSINDIIGEIFNARDIHEKHTCLDVQASLVSGAIPLLIAGVVVFLTSQLVLSYAKAAVHDRIDHLVPTGLKMQQEKRLIKAEKLRMQSNSASGSSPSLSHSGSGGGGEEVRRDLV